MSTTNNLGQYRLLSLVSVGQSTQLWYAYDEKSREFVGIKVLLPKFVKDGRQIASLKWELKIAQEFDHERVIKIHDYGVENKNPFLVMEWYPAPNVKMIINKGYEVYSSHLPEIMAKMAESLAILHAKRYVHCDVKPDNFLYDPDDQSLKLIDFALTKKAASGFSKIFSLKKKAMGTPSYMSGEQILGKPVDERADVYCLGCAFFELLSGKLPYTANSLNELLQKHVSGAIPPIGSKNRNLTPEMVNLLNSMMAKKPDDRPQNCIDLYDYIKKIRIFKRSPRSDDVN